MIYYTKTSVIYMHDQLWKHLKQLLSTLQIHTCCNSDSDHEVSVTTAHVMLCQGCTRTSLLLFCCNLVTPEVEEQDSFASL